MTDRLIDKYLHSGDVRPTVRNWPLEIRAIADGYRSYTTIPHAVQKDAIQNAWTARRNRHGRGWKLVFELVQSGSINFFQMTDTGTTGLTGRILTPSEYEADLPSIEKWGRFEGVAFTHPREDRTLGSRGRGKFIFVGASGQHTILYDTLKEDGLYRFGFRTVTRTESPIRALDGQSGKEMLAEITGGVLSPLEEVGTRVIIVDPIKELVDSLRTGIFLRHIGETWWEILGKYDANIEVRAFGRCQNAVIPVEFVLPEEDSDACRVNIQQASKFRIGPVEIKLKKLHIIHSGEKPVSDDIRGIAIQRGGMKICSIESGSLGREISDKIYGYMAFETDTEEALLADEGIEHYSYDYRGAYPRAVKRYIEDELMRFAQEKLGYGFDARETRRRQQRDAERMALSAINTFARTLGIGTGPGPRPGAGGGGGEPKVVRIQLEDLDLPRPGDLRINYGETAGNIGMRILNESDTDIRVRSKLFLRYFDRPMKTFDERDIVIPAHSCSIDIGPFEEELTESAYPDRGKYTIAAKIFSLEEEDKGFELDNKTKTLYLEEDPPMRGLFERCEAFGFPDEEPVKYWRGYSEAGSERGLVLYYNVNHPTYGEVSDSLEDLAEHILEIAGQEVCRYDLIQSTPVLFRGIDRDNPADILAREREVVGKILYKFRRKEI